MNKGIFESSRIYDYYLHYYFHYIFSIFATILSMQEETFYNCHLDLSKSVHMNFTLDLGL